MKKSTTLKIFGITFLAVLLFILTVTAQNKKKHLEIAITINELPASLGFTPVDKQALNYLMLQALSNHNVKAAGFVVGRYIEEDFDILGKWLNDGHTLGSMTNTNQDYHQIDATSFIDDIHVGNNVLEPMISGFGQKKRYFRFPYLHYGESEEAKEAATMFLEENNLIVSHATVVVDDFLFNLTLEKLGKYPDSLAFEQLKQEYLEHVTAAIQDAEFKSKDLLNRYCSQIIMLRANRLNALLLEDILQAIERMNYKFVTLDRALSDPVYQKSEAYFGSRGLGYLDMIIQSDPDLLPAE